MNPSGLVMTGSYDYGLVVLSILIAILDSYTALDLFGRVTLARGRDRLAWLIGGGVSMGIGIWSMHYIGMLAFKLPVPVEYDWPTVLISLLAGIVYSLLGLFIVGSKAGALQLVVGSIFMGAAIITLHYTGMNAMRLPGMCNYSPALVTLSVLLAVGGSLLSLRLGGFFRSEPVGRRWVKVGSALLMGAAIAGMHYTAMAAASFTRSDMAPDLSHVVNSSLLGTAGIGVGSGMVLLLTLLTSLIDRMQTHRTHLDELFEQAPQAVALMKKDNRVERVNREFTRVFGYTAQESIGRRLMDLIAPEELRADVQRLWDIVAQGQRVEIESIRQRKDRTRLHVSVLLVPFQVAGGETAIFAIFRDITERKEADEALRELSGQLLQLQDEERRRLARELHDSTGQKLAALGINLAVLDQSATQLDARSLRALAESLALTNECLRDIRTFAHLLHPPELDEFGLSDALSHFVSGFAGRSEIPIDLELSPNLGRLPREVETALFRIVQEALSNIHRHSGGSRARIRIVRAPGSVTLEIQDEGRGMGESAVTSEPSGRATTGVGIAGMRERVRQLGGKFEIQSTESGTTLKVVLPL